VKEPPSLSDLKNKLVAMEVVTPEAPMGAKTVKTKPQGKLTLFLNSFYGREMADKRFGNAGGATRAAYYVAPCRTVPH